MKTRSVIFSGWLGLWLIGPLSSSAVEPVPIRATHDREIHRPTARPDRIVLTWTGDPARSQAVTWRTDGSVARALAQIALATDKPQTSQREVEASSSSLESDLSLAYYHTVEFQDLEPDTLYAYRVGDSVNWSEWFQFRTAKAEAAPFTFLYFGDAQNNIREQWSRVVRGAFRRAPHAAFTLHAGDLINRAQSDADWGEWFGALAWIGASIPVLPTPGNHEHFALGAGPRNQRVWQTKSRGALIVWTERKPMQDDKQKLTGYQLTAANDHGLTGQATLNASERFISIDPAFTEMTGYTLAELVDRQPSAAPLFDRLAVPGKSTLTPHWRAQFALPTHGPPGLEESVYYIDYQGVRLISLNSSAPLDPQADWLRQALAYHPNRWTIITFHHPLFSSARGRDNAQLRAKWKPLFDEFKVDLVLAGHDHTYARNGGVPGGMRPGSTNLLPGYRQAYDPQIGTVYVVSVSGPKMYQLTNDSWMMRAGEDTQLFQVITVDGDELRFEARTATDQIYDSFRLKKRPGMANKLIEALPRENRRPPLKADAP